MFLGNHILFCFLPYSTAQFKVQWPLHTRIFYLNSKWQKILFGLVVAGLRRAFRSRICTQTGKLQLAQSSEFLSKTLLKLSKHAKKHAGINSALFNAIGTQYTVKQSECKHSPNTKSKGGQMFESFKYKSNMLANLTFDFSLCWLYLNIVTMVTRACVVGRVQVPPVIVHYDDYYCEQQARECCLNSSSPGLGVENKQDWCINHMPTVVVCYVSNCCMRQKTVEISNESLCALPFKRAPLPAKKSRSHAQISLC